MSHLADFPKMLTWKQMQTPRKSEIGRDGKTSGNASRRWVRGRRVAAARAPRASCIRTLSSSSFPRRRSARATSSWGETGSRRGTLSFWEASFLFNERSSRRTGGRLASRSASRQPRRREASLGTPTRRHAIELVSSGVPPRVFDRVFRRGRRCSISSAREKRRTAGVLQFAKRARPRTRPVRETPREPKADADVERPGMRARARVCVASRASASAARARVSFNRFSKRFSDGYFRLPRQRAFDAQARSVPGLNRPMSVWIKISFDHLESKARARRRTHAVDRRHAGNSKRVAAQKRGKVARTHRRGRTRDSLRGARARWRSKSAVCGVKARASDLSDRGRSRRLPLAGLPNPRSPILFALVVDNTA